MLLLGVLVGGDRFVEGSLVLVGVLLEFLNLRHQLLELILRGFPIRLFVVKVEPQPFLTVLVDPSAEFLALVEARDVALHHLNLLVQLLDASVLGGDLIRRRGSAWVSVGRVSEKVEIAGGANIREK